MRFSIRPAILSTIAAAGLASTLSAPADAQVRAPRQAATASAPFDANRIVTKVNQADLVAIVRQNGDTVVSEKEHGDVSVWARTEDGLNYILIGRVCDLPDYGPGCLGLEFQVRYDADANVTFDNINIANQQFNAAKIYRGPNDAGGDTVFVTHYTILDGGQKMGNLKEILINILAIAPQVSKIIWP